MTEHICSMCGTVITEENLVEFDDQELCERCLQEETSICRECGERLWNADDCGDSLYGHLCQDCRDDYFTTCVHCGRLIRNDDAHYEDDDEDEDSPYCYSCFCSSSEGPIHNYYFKPDPVFYGDGPRYLGVELEIDDGGENRDRADRILRLGNTGDNRIYCKHDGSLNDGFEIVTHPMSLDYHLHQMPWEEVMKSAAKMGYHSHQAGTCGLHVHVSRDALGDSESDQDAAIGRILFFVEKHWAELLKFSRRTESQMNKWARRYGYKDRPKEMLEHAKKGAFSRYACVNLTNADTIEFRMFRGTLKYNTLAATLELTDRICELCVDLSDEEIRGLSWSAFVAMLTEPELITYLKERRLYLNEPVESEAEI